MLLSRVDAFCMMHLSRRMKSSFSATFSTVLGGFPAALQPGLFDGATTLNGKDGGMIVRYESGKGLHGEQRIKPE